MAYIVLADFKTYLGITSADDDTLLSSIFAQAKSTIDAYTQTSFDVSADSTRYFTYGQHTNGRRLYFDTWLASSPTTVTNGDATVISSSDYALQTPNITPYHSMLLKSDANVVWTYDSSPENAISIAGKWGWSTTPPNDIVYAAMRLAAYMYRLKDSQVFEQTAFTELGPIRMKAGLPNDVREILDRYKWMIGWGT